MRLEVGLLHFAVAGMLEICGQICLAGICVFGDNSS
jgi:hypothetical protein